MVKLGFYGILLMMKVKNERRKYGRLPLVYPVEIFEPKKIKNAQTRDISIRGMCLITKMPFKEGSFIKMKLELGTEENTPIPIEGKVVWKMQKSKNEYHHGILITAIKEPEREIFRKFLATKLIGFLLK